MAAAFASEHSSCTDHCNAVNSNTGVTSATCITCVLVILTPDTTLMTTLTPTNHLLIKPTLLREPISKGKAVFSWKFSVHSFPNWESPHYKQKVIFNLQNLEQIQKYLKWLFDF